MRVLLTILAAGFLFAANVAQADQAPASQQASAHNGTVWDVVAPTQQAPAAEQAEFCRSTAVPIDLALWRDPTYGNPNLPPPTEEERAETQRICEQNAHAFWELLLESLQ